MVNAIACTIELWMHLGGLLSTQEARVALGMICSIGQMTTLYANMEKPYYNDLIRSKVQNKLCWHMALQEYKSIGN